MAQPDLVILLIVLGTLAYLLVTCVLRTLLLHGEHQIQLYDRVRQSRELRLNYLQSISEREQRFADPVGAIGPTNVDILDDNQ